MSLQYNPKNQTITENELTVATLSDCYTKDVMDEYGRKMAAVDDLIRDAKDAVDALQYAAFNINGMTQDELDPKLIESTCPAKTALVASKRLISAIQKATKGNLITQIYKS